MDVEAAHTPVQVNVGDFIDQQQVGKFQIAVLLLCAAAMFVDGFDTQAMGYVGPAISAAMAIKPAALGLVFAAGGLGVILGTLGFAPLADRVGRKPVLVGCVLFFALCSFATSMANSVPQIMWTRFATGLGLGGVVPNALALTADFMPRRQRMTLVLIAWSGFSIGSAVAGPVTAHILDSHTWKAIFFFGGLLPALLVPVLLWGLPESLQGMTQRGERADKIRRTLARINPRSPLPAGASYTCEAKPKGFPVAMLFREGRTWVTIPLWIMFFMILLELFFLSSWLPTILHKAGVAQGHAIVVASLLHFGGILGGLLIVPFCDRFNPYMVLAAAYVLSCVCVAGIGFSGGIAMLGVATTFMAGFFTFGGQNTANAVAASNYPTAMRSSGVGWALGIGRIGQIVGPLIGGLLLSLHWKTQDILYVIALPSVIAAAAALFLARSFKRLGSTGKAA